MVIYHSIISWIIIYYVWVKKKYKYNVNSGNTKPNFASPRDKTTQRPMLPDDE